jgi:hypothetical protein
MVEVFSIFGTSQRDDKSSEINAKGCIGSEIHAKARKSTQKDASDQKLIQKDAKGHISLI